MIEHRLGRGAGLGLGLARRVRSAVPAARDPSADLEKITAPFLLVNSADDFMNPPELGMAEREIKRVKRGWFVLLPATDATHGHGMHSWAAFWQGELRKLLDSSGPRR